MQEGFVETLLLSTKLGICVTICSLIIGLPLAYFFAYSNFRFKSIFQALLNLPLVLPPTVLGFYLLVAFSPTNIIGKFLIENFNIKIAFSFIGILIGSVIYNLPFMTNTLYNGFTQLSESLKEAAYTLGKSKFETLFYVLIPNIKSAIITGMCLTFAHTLGEFGIVLMIGGNVPGKTRVASIAIFDEVEALNYSVANQYSLVLLIASFFLLLIIYSSQKNSRKWIN